MSKIFFLLGLFASCQGALKFATYYQDHMVLQRGPQQAVIWGHATKIGDNVKVTISGHGSATTTVTSYHGGQGVWKVKLPAVTDKGPFTVTATSSEGTVSLTDVLFGDVWICSGQSNMGFTTGGVYNHTAEVAASLKFTNIRVLRLNTVQSASPLEDLGSHGIGARWTSPTTNVINHFSAVCWFFGEYLYPDLNYPIGLIETAWGGTPIEAWSSPDALGTCAHHTKRGPSGHSVLWNSMINPLLNMTIRGAIWYQGENNAGHPGTYSCLFQSMISDWRNKFHASSLGQTSLQFPFGFVQLAANRHNSLIGGFPGIRWAQTANKGTVPNNNLPNVFMAVAMDLPDFHSPRGSIHPRDKQDVARRLVLSARAVAYKESGVKYQGPLPKTVINDPAQHTLTITYDYGPVTVKNNQGFEVCCSAGTKCGAHDKWTAAAITSHHASDVTLTTSGCGSSHAVGLRYAWRTSPCGFKQCAIYGSDTSLPAPPYIYRNGFAQGPAIIGK